MERKIDWDLLITKIAFTIFVLFIAAALWFGMQFLIRPKFDNLSPLVSWVIGIIAAIHIIPIWLAHKVSEVEEAVKYKSMPFWFWY